MRVEARYSSSHFQSDQVRKRVCKACDRCRLKKTKCDGASPCLRCQADQMSCIFGNRKKIQNKMYPKGYVEMLEQQQRRLVRGLLELYQRTVEGKGWPGGPLKLQSNGHPLTHSLLVRLGVLDDSNDICIEEKSISTQPERCHDDRRYQKSSTKGLDDSAIPVDQSPFDSSCLQTTPPIAFTDNKRFSELDPKSPIFHSITAIEDLDCLPLQDGSAQWPLSSSADFHDPKNLTTAVDFSDFDFHESCSLPIFDKTIPGYSVSIDSPSFDQFPSARSTGPSSD